MKTKIHLAISIVFSVFALNANASGFDRCSQVFYKKNAPINVHKTLSKNTTPLCYTGFAVLHSPQTKTPLWSAEFVTTGSLQSAKQLNRVDSFHEESKLAESQRANLSDYRGSGYDRGHLAPNANRFSRADQYQSFSLANIVPQAPKNNQEVWNNIEQATRAMVTKRQEPMYVITGALHIKKSKKIGKGVAVPTHLYKVILLPKSGIVGAYVTVNDNNGVVDTVTVAQLQTYAGMVFFPTLNNTDVIKKRYDLPRTANQAYKQQNINILPPETNIFNINQDESALPVAKKVERTKDIKGFVVEKLTNQEKQTLKREVESIRSVFN